MTDIKYERNFTGSYMKLADIESESCGIDERILLKNKMQGLLSVEKYYVDGKGEFCYNITGKQSLDTFCQVKEIGIAIIEKIITSICYQIEQLELRLMDINCLRLEPSLIYVTNSTQEIIFTFYPSEREPLDLAFQRLMEYLLTRIDHKDSACVKAAYELYEKSLDEGYSILDIRDSIAHNRTQKVEENQEQEPCINAVSNMLANANESRVKKTVEDIPDSLIQRRNVNKKVEKDKVINKLINLPWITSFYQWINKWTDYKNRKQKDKKKERNSMSRVIYPDDIKDEVETPMNVKSVHPTICLSDYREHPEGLLLYEGYDNFPNIRIEKDSTRFGKGNTVDVDVVIAKDTVSQIHARIEKQEDHYYIEDLNSTNGTFVNDQVVNYKEKRELKSNDIVRLADVKYRFI